MTIGAVAGINLVGDVSLVDNVGEVLENEVPYFRFGVTWLVSFLWLYVLGVDRYTAPQDVELHICVSTKEFAFGFQLSFFCIVHIGHLVDVVDNVVGTIYNSVEIFVPVGYIAVRWGARTGDGEVVVLPVHVGVHYRRPRVARHTDRRRSVVCAKAVVKFVVNAGCCSTGEHGARPYVGA